MNGWINEKRSRPPDVWRIVLDLGPAFTKTGKRCRRQKWVTYRGTRREAEDYLSDQCTDARRGEFIVPTKVTLGQWLDEWLEKSVKPRRSPRTYRVYENAVRTHLRPRLGAIRLQALRPTDVDRFRAESIASGLAPATCRIHHAVLTSALNRALRDDLVKKNVATLAESLPVSDAKRRRRRLDDGKVWTVEEARRVLAAAKQRDSQTAAFLALALDSGARKGELLGLRWSDVDLTTGAVKISGQLLKGGSEPEFGPTKTGKERTLDLSAETLLLLREHKRKQAELKLANRRQYADHGLIFAQDWGIGQALGVPLGKSAPATMLKRLIRQTGVTRITVHGLRHTSATLLLGAGVPTHVVQKRLGHRKSKTTLDLYAHVLPDQQADAASRLAALLHG
jgi:integrase